MDSNNAIPDSFICPLTMELMKDPMMTIHGHNFEREAIIAWISMGNTCPLTRKPLCMRQLVSNKNLQFQIQKWEQDREGVTPHLIMVQDQDHERVSKIGCVMVPKTREQWQSMFLRRCNLRTAKAI